MGIRVLQGDITSIDVDVMVNAANERLARGSGVCGAVFAAAGPELDAACAELSPCATGDAVITPGFASRARWIVHAVGPIWRGGTAGEPALLSACYRRALELAADVGATSIALPAISTGVFGYPPESAAAVAVAAVTREPPPIADVVLVAFDAATAARYERLVAEATSLNRRDDP